MILLKDTLLITENEPPPLFFEMQLAKRELEIPSVFLFSQNINPPPSASQSSFHHAFPLAIQLIKRHSLTGRLVLGVAVTWYKYNPPPSSPAEQEIKLLSVISGMSDAAQIRIPPPKCVDRDEHCTNEDALMKTLPQLEQKRAPPSPVVELHFKKSESSTVRVELLPVK